MVSKIIITVLSVSGITGFLALILVIAEKIFADYGVCKVNINGEEDIEVDGGKSLLFALKEKKIFIPSACGGRGTCGYCKVRVIDGAGPLLPTEEPMLSKDEMKNNMRLACQVKVKKDIQIQIPEELFNIKEYKTNLALLKDLTYDIKLLHLELIEPKEINFKAGQYVQLETKPYGDIKETVMRAYSICSPSYEKNYIELMIRRVPDGICTTWVHDFLKEGEVLNIIGPMGEFYLREGESDIYLIAGGSGMAPIVSILYHILHEKIERNVLFFFGARTTKDLFYLDVMEYFEQNIPNFKFIPALSAATNKDKWEGEKGRITDVINKYIKDRDNSQAQGYLCGSPGMVKACINVLNSNNITNDRIFYDPFA